jgi:hypothetical protein
MTLFRYMTRCWYITVIAFQSEMSFGGEIAQLKSGLTFVTQLIKLESLV